MKQLTTIKHIIFILLILVIILSLFKSNVYEGFNDCRDILEIKDCKKSSICGWLAGNRTQKGLCYNLTTKGQKLCGSD